MLDSLSCPPKCLPLRDQRWLEKATAHFYSFIYRLPHEPIPDLFESPGLTVRVHAAFGLTRPISNYTFLVFKIYAANLDVVGFTRFEREFRAQLLETFEDFWAGLPSSEDPNLIQAESEFFPNVKDRLLAHIKRECRTFAWLRLQEIRKLLKSPKLDAPDQPAPTALATDPDSWLDLQEIRKLFKSPSASPPDELVEVTLSHESKGLLATPLVVGERKTAVESFLRVIRTQTGRDTSRDEFAGVSGWSLRTLQNWEGGKRVRSKTEADFIFTLGLTPPEFLNILKTLPKKFS